MDPTIQESANEELHVAIEVPEESTNHEKNSENGIENSENGIENSENGIENSENGIEMKPLKQQEPNVPSKSVTINVPITEKDENQSEIPQKRQKSASQRGASRRDSRRMTFSEPFKRLISSGETELDIEKFAKDVNESKAYDVSHILKLN